MSENGDRMHWRRCLSLNEQAFSIKQTIEWRKVYTHFSFDVFSDNFNDVMALYPGKMEDIKVRGFLKKHTTEILKNILPHRNT